jgi:hypothetical protein
MPVTVNKYATSAGKRYEADLTKLLRNASFDTERLRLSGVEDEGDILLRTDTARYVIEAKRTKGFQLSDWVRQAELERDNYARHRDLSPYSVGYVVIHYARGKGLHRSYVTTTLEEWIERLPL